MADEIDLERGVPSSRTEARRRRTERKGPIEGESKTLTEKLDRELDDRITAALEQLRDWRESRDDEELADAIERGKEKMSKGLVSVTHIVAPLRGPLVVILGFLEPVLAFGEVGRILIGRWLNRRQEHADNLAAAQAEWDANNPATQPEGIFTR